MSNTERASVVMSPFHPDLSFTLHAQNATWPLVPIYLGKFYSPISRRTTNASGCFYLYLYTYSVFLPTVSFYTLNFCFSGEYHTCTGTGKYVYGTRQQFQCSDIRKPKDPLLPVPCTRSVKVPGLQLKLPDTIVRVADR